MSWKEKTLENTKSIKYLKQERGAIFVVVALLLPALFGFLGLGYDVGNLYTYKARLQNTADATALAGGREYVNALKAAINTNNDSSTTTRPPTDAEKEAARTPMVTGANNYIANNNPVFNAKEGIIKKYEIGVQTNSNSSKTEFFRVTLTEPVRLTFLRALPGIPEKANVSVYATVRLSDTTLASGSGTSHDIRTEKYKPIVIAGTHFSDEKNKSVGIANFSNPNNTEVNTYLSEVYAVNGATFETKIDEEGNSFIPAPNQQTGRSTVDSTMSYNMRTFGEVIKEQFIAKMNYSVEQLADYRADMAIWNNGYERYLTDLNAWLNATDNTYVTPASLSDLIINCEYIEKYMKSWNDQTKLQSLWENDGKPLAGDFETLKTILQGFLKYKDYWDPFKKPGAVRWDGTTTTFEECMSGDDADLWNSAKVLLKNNGKRKPVFPATEYTGSLNHEPRLTDSKYGNLRYYGTYIGEKPSQGFSTLDISTNLDHSYFYLSPYIAGYAIGNDDTNITINVDKFYINNEEGITRDTPFYIFIDSDVHNVVQLKFDNYDDTLSRPLVFCNLSTQMVHITFPSNKTVRAIIYSPNSIGGVVGESQETHITGGGDDTFIGSIVSNYMQIKNQHTSFEYKVDEIAKWMKSDENPDGLTATPNIGFADSGAQIITEGENTSSQTTWPEHLQLVLKNQYNVPSWENISE